MPTHGAVGDTAQCRSSCNGTRAHQCQNLLQQEQLVYTDGKADNTSNAPEYVAKCNLTFDQQSVMDLELRKPAQ